MTFRSPAIANLPATAAPSIVPQSAPITTAAVDRTGNGQQVVSPVHGTPIFRLASLHVRKSKPSIVFRTQLFSTAVASTTARSSSTRRRPTRVRDGSQVPNRRQAVYHNETATVIHNRVQPKQSDTAGPRFLELGSVRR